MRRAISSIVIILLFGLGVWYVAGRLGGQKQTGKEDETPPPPPPPLTYVTKPEIGYLAPNFLLKTIDGRQIRLSDYLDKYVILNFWNTRCPFCLTELRNYNRLLPEYSGKVAILAINKGEASMVVDNFITSYLRPSNIVFILDPEDAVYRHYKGTSLPESFFVDTSGVIRNHILGELVYDEMQKSIKELLALPPATPGR